MRGIVDLLSEMPSDEFGNKLLAQCFRLGYIGDMQLREYISKNSITVAEFAQKIGVKSRATVHRYIARENPRIPEPVIMQRIFKETGGAVTANDFYGIAAKTKSKKTTKTT